MACFNDATCRIDGIYTAHAQNCACVKLQNSGNKNSLQLEISIHMTSIQSQAEEYVWWALISHRLHDAADRDEPAGRPCHSRLPRLLLTPLPSSVPESVGCEISREFVVQGNSVQNLLDYDL